METSVGFDLFKLISDFSNELIWYTGQTLDKRKLITEDTPLSVLPWMKTITRSVEYSQAVESNKKESVEVLIPNNDSGKLVNQILNRDERSPFLRNLLDEYRKVSSNFEKQLYREKEYVVTNLSSLIEVTITQLIGVQFSFRPEQIKPTKMTIKLQDYGDYDDFNEFTKDVTSDYYAQLMYKSFTEWSDMIVEKLAANVKSKQGYKDSVRVLKEMFLRRNLYIHNSGRVSEKYLNQIPNSDMSKNDYMITSSEDIEEYEDACFTFISMIVLELVKQDAPDKFDQFIEIGLLLYNNRKYQLGINYYKKLTKYFDSLNEPYSQDSYFSEYNEKLGYVLSGSRDENVTKIQSFVKKYKENATWWSQIADVYTELAVQSLLENQDDFYLIATEKIEESIEHDEIELVAQMLNWPMFKTLDKTKWADFVVQKYRELV